MDSRRKFVAKRYQITEVSLPPMVKTTRTSKQKEIEKFLFYPLGAFHKNTHIDCVVG